jgi:hypothetical protein
VSLALELLLYVLRSKTACHSITATDLPERVVSESNRHGQLKKSN